MTGDSGDQLVIERGLDRVQDRVVFLDVQDVVVVRAGVSAAALEEALGLVAHLGQLRVLCLEEALDLARLEHV